MMTLRYDPYGLGIIELFGELPAVILRSGQPVTILDPQDTWDDNLPTYIERIAQHGKLDTE